MKKRGRESKVTGRESKVTGREKAATERETADKKLQELDKVRTDFMNMASHELKTPLTAIYANLELLEEAKEKLSEKNINNLNALRRSSNQLRLLVDNILEIARVQSNELELNISEVDSFLGLTPQLAATTLIVPFLN